MDLEEDADDPGAGSSISKGCIIWKYFKKEGGKKPTSKCNHCDKSLCTPTGTTSTLLRHLKAAHPAQYAAYFKEHSEKEMEKEKKKSKQSSILSFGFQKKTLTSKSPKARALTKHIALMLVENYLPYNLVESATFKNLLAEAEPGYHVPCRTTFSRNIIPKLYESTKLVIQNEIDTAIPGLKCVSITTDMWTSRANESYMSMTVHYIDTDFLSKKYTLATSHFPGNHTAVNINLKLDSLLRDWHFDTATCPIYIVSDNARNMVAAINLSPVWTHVPCFAHSVQLAIVDAKKSVDGFTIACTKSRAIVTHYHKSATAAKRLEALQIELEKPQHELIQSVETRWGSEYQMLSRLLEQREPISAEIANSRKIDNLTIAEWDLIQEYATYLEPLHQATTEMCGEEYPTMSMVIPVLSGAIHVIDSLINQNLRERSEATRVAGISFGRELRKAIRARFPLYNTNREYLLSMVLDHRYKAVLLTPNERAIATNFLKQEIASLNVNQERIEPVAQIPETVTKRPLSLWDRVDEMSSSTDKPNVMSVEDEITMYFKVPNQRSENPLKWWGENAIYYPRLRDIAMKFLSIPASQVSSERMFSTAGNIVTTRRENLDTNHVEELTFLHDAIHLIK